MNNTILPPLPPCPTEDSDNCIWLASEQGNGEGHSFYTFMGETTYINEGPVFGCCDTTPVSYAGLMVALVVGLLLLRKIAIKKNRK